MPFVDGWDQENCPVEVNDNNFYAVVIVKGENLTKDWLTNIVKGGYYNGGNELETTIGDITDYENGSFGIEIYFSHVYGEGDTVRFVIDGITSAWMNATKSN